MGAGDWIAVYAAVVGTATFVWQCVTYWQARLPNLSLGIEPSVIVVNGHGAMALLAHHEGREIDPKGWEWFFDLRITNQGRSRVQVTSIRISQAAPSGRLGWDAGRRLDLPLWLEPGGRKSFRFTDDDLEEAKITVALSVNVSVSIGKDFKISKPILGPNTATITSGKLFEHMVSGTGLADKIFKFEVYDLEPPSPDDPN